MDYPLTFDFGLDDLVEGMDDRPMFEEAKKQELSATKPPAKDKESNKRLARCGKCDNCCRQVRALHGFSLFPGDSFEPVLLPLDRTAERATTAPTSPSSGGQVSHALTAIPDLV